MSLVYNSSKSCSQLIVNFLRLITTVWGKTSKMSCFREFWTQVFTNRALSLFYRFCAYYSCMRKKVENFPFSRSSVQKYHKSCSLLIWPFCGLLQLYEVKLQKFHFSVSLVYNYSKSFSQLIWAFYNLLQLYEVKLQRSHIFVN